MQGEYVSSGIDDGLLLIRVDFAHDLSAAEQERAAAELVAAAGETDLPVAVVDLGGVGAAYSRFLAALLSVRQERSRRGGRVLLAALRPMVAKTLERCALDVLFEQFPTVEAAREAARVQPV